MKNKIILALLLITIFSISTIDIPATIKRNKSSKQTELENQQNEEITDKKPPNEVEPPKKANPGNSEQEYNFSMETNIEEQWNKTWSYENLTSNKGEIGATMWQFDTTGNNVSFMLKITDLKNSSSPMNELIYPSNLTCMYAMFLNDSKLSWGLIQDNGLGGGIFEGFMIINKTVDGVFNIDADYWIEPTNITFNATVSFRSINNITIKTDFIPTIENTKSDYIIWELKYNNSFFPFIPSDSDYKAILDIDENFTLSTALGYDSGYWVPLDSVRTPKNLTIYGYYEKYKIELLTLNYICITYNNNLTSSKRELNLYTTCKMAGNLTIRFKITNGTVIELMIQL